MGSYVSRRVLEMVPTLLILSMIVFGVMHLVPGDPILAIFGSEAGSPDAGQRAALEHQLGLDRPLPVQYAHWLANTLHGDWGKSIVSRQPVASLIGSHLGVTAQIALGAWLLALVLGIPVGVLSAVKRNSWTDVVINITALSGVAIPDFLLALALIVVFSVQLGWLPPTGIVSLRDDPVGALQHLALPVIALSTGLMASLVRQTRSAMLEVLSQDYVRTARSKGLANHAVIVRHALSNALIPIITVAALQLRFVLSGTIIIETMFAIPGLGRLTIESVVGKDYPVIQILVLLIGLFTITSSLAADLLYARADPRIRLR